ncbi:levanase/fructan beta-fructosidase [Paenibacillus rhizosphaerae]|uniref:Levanase/fructan beta-fructosidase n=1 Tax=Paenibacillus rhizosphaerae TaxID=297318 RepID=A0A839TG39_9BACL|nr:glycoside hydrolase family 32 protein [Paenibacillus rhizosphaerae]MBB3125671.1 levanase/fructan beta-fructosidase [Paenibacillus rhizosphaerae]
MSTFLSHNYRGAYHFSPKENWMNDPNGMVFFQGEYHLFYQYHPYSTIWGPMHWGHAVSRDLVVWEDLPIALAPDEHGTIFSGSAVVDWNNTTGFFGKEPGLVAIFTQHAEGAEGEAPVQRQSLAYSTDAGRTWTKYAGNPVLAHDTFVDFRDPKVFWHEASAQWVMIVACGQTVCLYRSPNLIDWTLSSEFGEEIGSHDGVWECPDLFPLPVDGNPDQTKWVMLVSIGDHQGSAEGSRTQYFTGDFDGERFKPDAASQTRVRWIDYGRDNYAGVSWSDVPAEDGRRLFIGWMSNWKYAGQTPTGGWRGAMTAPRELRLQSRSGSAELIQQPARELEAYRKEVLSLKQVTAAQASAKLAGLQLESGEIRIGFVSGSLEMKVRAGAGRETVIGYSAAAGEVYIDRTRAGAADFHPLFAGRHTAVLDAADGTVDLRILIDRSSVEVFAGEGLAVLTDLIYPDQVSTGLSLAADDEETLIDSLDIYELSI